MKVKDRARRFAALKAMPCLTCPGCGITEIHHLNGGGKAGQKRRGDEYTVPLGTWAHRGVPLAGWTAKQMEVTYGPSLARNSKAFRARYGTDDLLLRATNELLEIGHAMVA